MYTVCNLVSIGHLVCSAEQIGCVIMYISKAIGRPGAELMGEGNAS